MKNLLAVGALCVCLVVGCAVSNEDHARAYVSYSISTAERASGTEVVKVCPMCDDTGCPKSGSGDDLHRFKDHCPQCGKKCSRAGAQPAAPELVGGKPITLFASPNSWVGQPPDIQNPKPGDVWNCTDGKLRRWGGNGKWQVKVSCRRDRYGRVTCQWGDET